ncbi:MAG: proton-conducting transporter membrane subunit [Planctomycetaceae bacterium]
MNELHLPWLELAIVIPLVGAGWVSRRNNQDVARAHSLFLSTLTWFCTIGAWQDLGIMHQFEAHDRWDLTSRLFGRNIFVIDELSAPLLPLAALLYVLTILATLRTKVQRFSFSLALASEAILLATLSCKLPWLVIALLALGVIPPWIELRERRKSTRIYLIHMGAFVFMLISGQVLWSLSDGAGILSMAGVSLLMGAVLLRSGIVPVHCWMSDLFEKASFGTALLFVTSMVGAYACIRLVLPIAPGWVLHSIALVSLFTAFYAAGMALIQREARRFFCYLFLSNSSLVLVGLETVTPIGMTGALCLWISVGLSLVGFGLTLRSVESRIGELTLNEYRGLYNHTPMLAAFFLLTGLASIGFPGTIGFVGTELLVEGAVQLYPVVGSAVVVVAALNGLAVLHAYFRIFTGTTRTGTIDLRIRKPERLAVLILTALILGGGIFPQPGVTSRYHASIELVKDRTTNNPDETGPNEAAHHAGLDDVETGKVLAGQSTVAKRFAKDRQQVDSRLHDGVNR